MLHTALAHAGGMRIDHAMGLNRLWVIPDGASGADGAYLGFPETDLIRLIALESQRHRAIVLAEDLGTVPEGFQDRLRNAGIAGMRVLWFERAQDDSFTPPWHWTQRAAAMTSTHDLPSLAGWWRGHDLALREQLGQLADPDAARKDREQERHLLWEAFRQSGAGAGERPAPDETDTFADAACVHIGRSACELVLLPLEDALGLVEQPNLPGTTDEHPNWRRRLDADAQNTLDAPATKTRLQALQASRHQG
jgi:4-alpha-glucanotransferase